MMTNKIKVLVVDDVASRNKIINFLESDNEIIICGQAATASETLQKAQIHQPDIVLMATNLPDTDGFASIKSILREAPCANVILTSLQGGHEDMRKAMMAGAKDFIIKPFAPDDLILSLKQVYANNKCHSFETEEHALGKVITLFSTKGGVGKTVLSINLALALASKYKQKVAIVDFDLQFGDIAICLNMLPKASIADVVTDIEHLDEVVLTRYMFPYNEYLHILPAPFQPEAAEKITGQHLAAVLTQLKKMYQYIIIDTAAAFDDKTLATMDFSDIILVVSVPDLTTTKNVKLSMETLETLGYSPQKIKLVMNRAYSKCSLNINDIEDGMQRKVNIILPNDSEIVMSSVNKGIPFIASQPNSLIAQAIFDLAETIVTGRLENSDQSAAPKKAEKSIFNRLKSFLHQVDSTN